MPSRGLFIRTNPVIANDYTAFPRFHSHLFIYIHLTTAWLLLLFPVAGSRLSQTDDRAGRANWAGATDAPMGNMRHDGTPIVIV